MMSVGPAEDWFDPTFYPDWSGQPDNTLTVHDGGYFGVMPGGEFAMRGFNTRGHVVATILSDGTFAADGSVLVG